MSILLLLTGLLALVQVQVAATRNPGYCPVFYIEPPKDCRPIPGSFLNFNLDEHEYPNPELETLDHAFNALEVLQREYFDTNFGTWPDAIDWTAAVAETVMTGMLTTLTKSLSTIEFDGDWEGNERWKAIENLISSYYAQVVASYFGQDILSIRGQAFDDILWVVLGWIEAINFVSAHANLHYPCKPNVNLTGSRGIRQALETLPWHGNNWVNSFAHRSRVFWHLATRGWDTKLCRGGMTWNPRLEPYKNAITNELWISASISMYRYFPGDNYTAPWISSQGFPEKDPAHLAAAIEGYKWLKGINMTNNQGLYVDGYHISAKPGNIECDKRQEMVYTYNQGVILTGQRELWAVTGSASYLEEGHKLIQSVINATGWDLKRNKPVDDLKHLPPGWLPQWRGLGRGGIMEEQCDASGTCSQDGQTFKGIFFHHFTAFCAALDPVDIKSGLIVDARAYHNVKNAHADACRSYYGWIKHNAQAALNTRDAQGKFGMWWGADIFNNAMATLDNDGIDHEAENTTDYRNLGTPEDNTWGRHGKWLPGSGGMGEVQFADMFQPESEQVLSRVDRSRRVGAKARSTHNSDGKDPNDRGRGRRVETQIGGIALMRAYWEMSNLADGRQ